ncbi:hypothetical protein RHI9324_05461 [Rhizobium sp. CECT 9324]|nr:hypothetical protein RHI9324_05461 [Rhizobium sp. CECT 9324]
MCTSKPKVTQAATPAPAPAPPLEPAEVPEVGEARRRQSEQAYGQEAPNYRVKRTTSVPSVNPNRPITM